MKSEEIYETWKKRKSRIEIGKGFSDRVMNQIHQYEREKRASLYDVHHLIEFISSHPLAKAGVVVAGALIGFVRVAFTVHILLFG